MKEIIYMSELRSEKLSRMTQGETNGCSKVCWELLALTEQQTEIIKKLTLRVKELESLLNVTQ